MFMTTLFHFFNLARSWLTPKRALFLALLIVVFIGMGRCYRWGYESALEDSEKSYKLALENSIEKTKKDLQAIYEEEKRLIESNKKIEIQYKDRVKVVEKIVSKNVYLESEACAVPLVDVKEFNKSLENKQ